MLQYTYIMPKPIYANVKNFNEYVIHKLISFGFTIIDAKYVKYDVQAGETHYEEHVLEKKPFVPDLINYITLDKAYGIEVRGENAVPIVKEFSKLLRKAIINPSEFLTTDSEILIRYFDESDIRILNGLREEIIEELSKYGVDINDKETMMTMNVLHATDFRKGEIPCEKCIDYKRESMVFESLPDYSLEHQNNV